MNFIEIKTRQEVEEAYLVLRELAPDLEKKAFLDSLNHDLAGNHKLFGLTVSGKLVSVAAVWLLINGLSEKLLWINAFVTTKRMRSKGYGTRLLRELQAYAARDNFAEMRVHAHRQRAIAFWRAKADFDPFSHVLRKKIDT